jgi:hypothetical protein
MMYLITLRSKQQLSNSEKDFIAELISEEARKAVEPYHFTLHDIFESENCSQLVVEGTNAAVENLMSVIKDNLPYKPTCSRCDTIKSCPQPNFLPI